MNTTIVIAVPDMMISSRIADVARAKGFATVDANVSTLSAKTNADTALIVIDIGQNDDWEAALRALKADDTTAQVPVLCFGPHVASDALRTAVAAGSDRLVTRGKLMAELPQLIEANARRTASD